MNVSTVVDPPFSCDAVHVTPPPDTHVLVNVAVTTVAAVRVPAACVPAVPEHELPEQDHVTT